ncbi:FimB/Mfa2 family fimbrial subunit [Bacteroides sp.]|uniref:FimB/Mfa2 family fimbrial subunit n=1 Tax=Bacteroides sp. TaxID=29523 RepID=UPI002A82E357|nr:FimB/Mfa2 family fimbrial subunit [Bacteroides sp.]
MKFKHTINKICFPFVAAVFIFSSCIKEDVSDCPVPGMRLSPRFTMHTQKDANGEYRDMFGETARKVDYYIFDEAGLLVEMISEEGKFLNGQQTEIPRLAAGKYRVVTWVNNQDATALNIIPQKNITTVDELLLSLKEAASKQITLHPESLLYGFTEFTVTTSGNQVIPVDLIRDTNKIRVIVRWKNKATKDWCFDTRHAETTRLYLNGDNGTLKFDNTVSRGNWLTYIPKYFTGDELEEYEEKKGAATVATEFYIMRLVKDESKKELHIKELQPGGTDAEETVFSLKLMDYIRDYFKASGQDYTQEALDRKETFLVELEFDCTAWVAMSIAVEGWVLVDNGTVEPIN